mmetsp:Transcript_26704/g.65448  ORF Transcript_26704/g.65448 Transcript_26704/m.65448 type:complete len:265 (+) Transcript_26704:1108-1902(+)
MAPSMAQPTCRPKPILTSKSGMRLMSAVSLRYVFSLALRRKPAMMTMNAASALLPMRSITSRFSGDARSGCSTSSTVMFLGNFHTSRKASPMFLLALPPCKCVSMCTIFPMVFTNSMMPSCSTSVVSVNCRMSQNPKMATTFFPGIMGLISPPRFMFSAITSDPASPNPTASSPQILAMLFSSKRVSICSSPGSSSCMGSNLVSGFSLTSRTFFTMRSMGFSTRSLASLLKNMAPSPSTMHTNTVRHMLRAALSWLLSRMSKNA